MKEFLLNLRNNVSIKILLICIVLDTLFGILRAIRYRKINSAIGIDGIIRKSGMLLSIFFFEMIDYVINLDLMGFIPVELKNYINIERVGIGFLFELIYIIFEFLSVLKNMILCKIPIPKKLQVFLNKLLKEFTQEIKEEGEKK